MTKFQMRRINYIQYLKGLERKTGVVTVTPPFLSFSCSSHLDTLYRLVNGLKQSPVFRVLVAVFIGKHVGQGFYIAVEVLL